MKDKKPKELDLRSRLDYLYHPSPRKVEVVEVPRMDFLMVDGEGDPENASFQEAVDVLYKIAFTTKFKVRKESGIDYPVMPLEGLWSSGKEGEFDVARREGWRWTLMIFQPELVTAQLIEGVVGEIGRKKEVRGLGRARLSGFKEGLSAQILHLGPYSTEAATIRMLDEYIERNGRKPRGRHHEVYLGDPRRTAPARLRTILRHQIG